MNFQQFVQFRAETLASDPAVLDCGETNIWQTLSHLVPSMTLESATYMHRCHLAELWLDTMSLPSDWKSRTMISCGVRHSLTLLLSEFAKQPGTLVMPRDVYPVYGQIAESVGITVELFATVPELQLPSSGRWLLIPNPLKPAGRWLTSVEVGLIQKWLNHDSARRVIIDAVYNFALTFHESTMQLVETQQAYLLHSLSKAWLHPKIMGTCLIPIGDHNLATVFRNNSPPQSNLQIADFLLRHREDVPPAVDAELTEGRDRMQQRLPAKWQSMLNSQETRVGYLTVIPVSSATLLRESKILSIPLTVFGSLHKDFAVLSSLPHEDSETVAQRNCGDAG